jgi:hypothetical protein
MKRLISIGSRIFLCFVALSVVSIACQKDVSVKPAGNTSLQVFLTDDQSIVFDKVFIDILKIEVKTEDDSTGHDVGDDHGGGGHGGDDNGGDDHGGDDHGGSSGDDDGGNSGSGGGGSDDNGFDDHGGWIALDINPGIYNIMELRNGLDTLIGTGSFPTAHTLKKVRVTLGSNNSVVLNGETFPLIVKDNNNTVIINLEESRMIRNGSGALNFWLDFDAGRSIRQLGNEFELRSSIRAFSREKAGSIEGRVVPADAQAIVYAISGTDTSTAKPGHEGEFKFVGLKPGVYSLFIDATAGNYQDATINGVAVSKNEDTHVAPITLHQ